MSRRNLAAMVAAALLASASASGQTLEDRHLFCGGQSYDFDELLPATESVFTIRQRELEALQRLVVGAQQACAPAGTEPWCQGLARSLSEWSARAAETCTGRNSEQCVEARRSRERAESALARNAARAWAHRHCSTFGAGTSDACEALLAAEELEAPAAAEAVRRHTQEFRERLERRLDRLRSSAGARPALGVQPQAAIDSVARLYRDIRSVRAYLAEVDDFARRRLATPQGGGAMAPDAGAPTDASTNAPVALQGGTATPLNALAEALSHGRHALHRAVFYMSTSAAPVEASLRTADTSRVVLRALHGDDALLEVPTATSPSLAVIRDGAAQAADASEPDADLSRPPIQRAIDALEGQKETCANANIHVLPSGLVEVHASPRNLDNSTNDEVTVCIDVSDYGTHRAYRVEFLTTAPDPVDRVEGADRTRPPEVWPGEVAAVTIPRQRGAVVRMVVYGVPRGRSLRVLAARELEAASVQNARDIYGLQRLQADVDSGVSQLRALQDGPRAVTDLALRLVTQQPIMSALFSAQSAARSLPANASAAALEEAKKKVLDLNRLASDGAAQWAWNDQGPAVGVALERLSALLLAPQAATSSQVLREALDAISTWLAAPSLALTAAQTELLNKQRTLTQVLQRICRVAQTEHRAVVHDLLLPPGDAVLDVIDYDAERGYVGSLHLGGSARPSEGFHEDVPLYARVSRVPGNQTVTVSVGGRPVVTTASRVLGVGDAGVPVDASITTRTNAVEEPIATTLNDVSYQLPGTRVVYIGRLEPGMRHEVLVCVGTSSTASCAPGSTTIGRNELVVHGGYHFGVLAGFGASLDLTGSVPYALHNSPDSNTWMVVERRPPATLSMPLLLTWYPFGRDPLTNRFTVGLGAGVDLTAPLERFYPLALTFAAGEVGVTLGMMVQVPNDKNGPARVTAGTAITQMAGATNPPDLGAIFGRDTAPTVGAFAAVTFDLDLFRRAFGVLFKDKLPALN